MHAVRNRVVVQDVVYACIHNEEVTVLSAVSSQLWYFGYLRTGSTGDFLVAFVLQVIESSIEMFHHRVGKVVYTEVCHCDVCYAVFMR